MCLAEELRVGPKDGIKPKCARTPVALDPERKYPEWPCQERHRAEHCTKPRLPEAQARSIIPDYSETEDARARSWFSLAPWKGKVARHQDKQDQENRGEAEKPVTCLPTLAFDKPIECTRAPIFSKHGGEPDKGCRNKQRANEIERARH